MRAPVALSLVLLAAPPLVAQDMRAGPPPPPPPPGVGVAAIRPLYQRVKDLYLQSAEVMPAERYGFRPTPEVRTFAQLLGHVANENYLFCAPAMGVPNPNTADYEKTEAKAELIQALEASFAFCTPAYDLDDQRAAEEVTFFGSKGSRLWVLNFNVVHDSEHYGNIVTYLRMNGVVPPSSRSGT